MRSGEPHLTPELLLRGYAAGVFPMSEGRDDPEVFWVDPIQRGILPLDGFHISRSLRRAILKGYYDVRLDSDFAAVVAACAERSETWINRTIAALYTRLHQEGRAHSLELWDGSELIGGVYGVTLGGAFFGESMFSRRRDASKIALAYLVHMLRVGGFQLFDTQFITEHLRSLGGVEISRADYHDRLEKAKAVDAMLTGPIPGPQEVIQPRTQTS